MTDEEKLESTETEPTPSEPQVAEPQSEASAEEIAKAEASEWRDKYVRKLAEFENFRKRTRQENDLLGQIISESLIVSLLPIMDDFDRLLSNIPTADDPYRKGVELIRGKLWTFFETRNVKIMDVRGKAFDPNEHDALLMRPTQDFPPGTVLEVITAGYTMGDRVIRHAQVIVSEKLKPETESA
jgi:molecular chaperone GrpE